MMKCFECDKTSEIKKFRAYRYTGVNLDNIVLLNVEVEVCSGCGAETPLLRNVKKLQDAIGVAIALQNVELSKADIRYLRRAAGFNISDWAKRMGSAEAHYSRIENSDRTITPQLDKLARINFLNALKQKDPENVELAKHLEKVLNLKTERHRGFVIAVNAEDPAKPAKYLPEDSSLFAEPETSFVKAGTLPFETLASVKIFSGHSLAMSASANQEAVTYA